MTLYTYFRQKGKSATSERKKRPRGSHKKYLNGIFHRAGGGGGGGYAWANARTGIICERESGT